MIAFHRLRFAAATAMAIAGVAAITVPTPARACGDGEYIGMICYTSANYCPRGFISAQGQILQIASYPALAALLGNRYGGNGQTTFALPDLRVRVPVGAGTPVAPLSSVGLGQQVGSQTRMLTAAQVPVPPHTHASSFTPTIGTQRVTIPATAGSGEIIATSVMNASQSAGASGQPSSTNNQVATLTGGQKLYAPLGGTQVALAGLSVSLNTTNYVPPIPAATVPITTVTGGAVALTAAGTTATAPVGVQTPAVGLTTCIVHNGLFPPRP